MADPNAFVPYVKWEGEKTGLHLKIIDDVVLLFDREGRLLDGVTKVQVNQEVDGATRVSVEMYVERAPD